MQYFIDFKKVFEINTQHLKFGFMCLFSE